MGKDCQGFTLIELLGTVAIIAVLDRKSVV